MNDSSRLMSLWATATLTSTITTAFVRKSQSTGGCSDV
jgi:hypothetical protein